MELITADIVHRIISYVIEDDRLGPEYSICLRNTCKLFSRVLPVKLDSLTDLVLFGKRIELLEYFRELGVPWGKDTLQASLVIGFDMFEYCHRNGAPQEDDILLETCNSKDDDSISFRYALTHMRPKLLATRELAFRLLIANDRVKDLGYLILKDYEQPDNLCGIAFSYGSYKCLEYLHKTLLRSLSHTLNVSMGTNLTPTENITRCFQYLYENGGFYEHKDLVYRLLVSRNITAFKYVIEHGGKLDSRLLSLAVEFEDFKLVKYLLKRDCAMNATVIDSAIQLGQLDIVEALHEKNCPWSDESVTIAANISIEMLKYVFDGGAEWNLTLKVIKFKGKRYYPKVECMKYLKRNTRI